MEIGEDFVIPVNEYQTPVNKQLLDSLPEEVGEQLLDFIDNVEYIRRLISPDRKRAKDLPRDEKGRIIVDITEPHILEDMDYFRPSALFYQKNKCYTFLRPNPNPNSEYKKWFDEEKRRCREGYVRESDGEWVTGYMYWYMNYCPIMLNKTVKGSKKAIRVQDFPETWEGIYLRFHYLEQARDHGNHAIELARRGCSKSFSLASMMAKNLILGESSSMTKRVTTILTAYQKEYLADKDGTLSKFEPMINFIAENTEFPRLRLRSSSQEMFWQMGYVDSNGRKKGSLNTVMGVSSKDDEAKLRGKRGHIYFEEMGSFKNLLTIYDTVRYGLEEGNYTFGLAYLVGTAAEDASDFESAKTLLYSPEGYNIYGVNNIYDRPKQGRPTFGYFFPAFLNRLGCYNEDGVSDVIKALVEILMNRYKAKYSTDPNSVLRVIAEMPITPAEAILKVKASYFPTVALTERLTQLDTDPKAFDDVYVGELNLNAKTGKVEFKPTGDTPIRKFGGVDNSTRGAIEIFEMPQKDLNGSVYNDRYIIGHDPVDNDQANSSSLSSTIVLDLFTDRIVAEYTGRQPYANDNFEIVRKLCIFYNAKCLYEAHPYDQKVRMPDGSIKRWEDVNIGDTLFAPYGKTVKVIDIPVEGEDDIYRLTLEDGRQVEASSNHIWNVFTYTNPRSTRNVTTLDIYNKGVKNKHGQHIFFIPESGGVEYPYSKTDIDPYALGLLIAEGAFTKFKKERIHNKKRNYVQFSSSKDDAVFYGSVLPYPIKYIGNKGFSWHMYIEEIDTKLEKLGLLHKNSSTKFIPDSYLFNDYETRLELLKGLMDGDGCAIPHGASVFITTSKALAEDVLLLCRSLGIKANFNKGKQATDNSKESFRVAIHAATTIFKLPRKIKKQHIYRPAARGSKAGGFLRKTAISNIEYIGRKKCKCVTVNSEDGLYLVGDYVVTHNCNKKGLFAYMSMMNCTHMLADTPQYLRDKQLIKYSAFGSNAKGVNASAAVNDYANERINDWLVKPVNTVIKEDGVEKEVTVPNLYFIRNRALLQELIAYTPEINVDRIRALGMAMLYRQEKYIQYGGNFDAEDRKRRKEKSLANDNFFNRNYDKRKAF